MARPSPYSRPRPTTQALYPVARVVNSSCVVYSPSNNQFHHFSFVFHLLSPNLTWFSFISPSIIPDPVALWGPGGARERAVAFHVIIMANISLSPAARRSIDRVGGAREWVSFVPTYVYGDQILHTIAWWPSPGRHSVAGWPTFALAASRCVCVMCHRCRQLSVRVRG